MWTHSARRRHRCGGDPAVPGECGDRSHELRSPSDQVETQSNRHFAILRQGSILLTENGCGLKSHKFILNPYFLECTEEGLSIPQQRLWIRVSTEGSGGPKKSPVYKKEPFQEGLHVHYGSDEELGSHTMTAFVSSDTSGAAYVLVSSGCCDRMPQSG